MGLFNVLDLFADGFEEGFEFNDLMGDFAVVAFGACGVDFTEEFLAEEIKGASTGGIAGEEGFGMGEVSFKSSEFFGDVTTFGKEGDFAF